MADTNGLHGIHNWLTSRGVSGWLDIGAIVLVGGAVLTGVIALVVVVIRHPEAWAGIGLGVGLILLVASLARVISMALDRWA